MNIELDASGPLRTINNMLRRLAGFRRDIAHELSDWQTQDVGRAHAYTKRASKGVYQTKFRPHSLYEMKRGRVLLVKKTDKLGQLTSKRKRVRLRKRKPTRVYRRWSTRPILRPVLEAELQNRMRDLLRERLRWH